MTDSEVQWLARRIDALEEKMDEYVKVHGDAHDEINKAVKAIDKTVTSLLGAINLLKWILGAPLFVGMVLLLLERVAR